MSKGGRGKIHEHPNSNTNGLDKNPQNINKNGRKPSLKKQLAKIGLSEGYMTFEPEECEVLEDGKLRVKVPKEAQMAMKVFKIAMKGNDTAALNAIKLYAETFDGKPDQNINLNGTVTIQEIDASKLSPEQIEALVRTMRELDE